MASKRLIGSSSAARRVWENDDLATEALAFADVDTLIALRSTSRHARDLASADAVWRPRVLSLPCARAIHEAGYLPSLTFATFLRLRKKTGSNTTQPRFKVTTIEHDKYAIAFEVWSGGVCVFSTVCDFASPETFPAGELREWAVRARDSIENGTCNLLQLDDDARLAIDSLNIPLHVNEFHFAALLVCKSDGKLMDLQGTIDSLMNDENGFMYIDVASQDDYGERGWDFGKLALDFRRADHEDPVGFEQVRPSLGMVFYRNHTDLEMLVFGVLPRAPDGRGDHGYRGEHGYDDYFHEDRLYRSLFY